MSYQLIYDDLTKDEMTLFYLLCNEANKSDSSEASLKISDFTVELHGTEQQWTKMVMDMMNHILNVKGYEDINGIRQYYCFFQRYRYKVATKEILFRISDEAYLIVSNICRDITLDEFIAIGQMTGKYTSRLCQLLMPYKLGGYKEININEIYDILEIPKTYPIKEISRVIVKPAIKQITKLESFKNLRYRYFTLFQETRSIIFEWDTAISIRQREKEKFEIGKPLMDSDFNSFFNP